MKTQTLKSLLTLWNSQGLFQGDVNRVRQYCKSWCISQEGEQKLDLLKVQTLAQNPEIYKAIFEPLVDTNPEGEWQTLGGEDEEALIAEFSRWQSQREDL